MKTLIINILFLIVVSTQLNNTTYIQQKSFDGYIFSKDHFILISVENQQERYTPSKEDVIQVERLIRRNLWKVNNRLINQGGSCPIIHKNLKNYIRQYFGFVNKNGEKIIRINFVWKTKSTDGNISKDVYVLDGCSYYWNIKVNIDSEKLFDLMVNGEG